MLAHLRPNCQLPPRVINVARVIETTLSFAMFRTKQNKFPLSTVSILDLIEFRDRRWLCNRPTNLPTSHLLGSVPTAVTEDKRFTIDEVPDANMQIFPPNGGRDGGNGYQSHGRLSEDFNQPATNWKGVFSISSYTQYFNVDTDIVLNRTMSSLHPMSGDFFGKIDANPDLYGIIWISTTLVFMLASLGNCSAYLREKHAGKVSSWKFDVDYFNMAACLIYGYAIVVPAAYYFLLQYLGSTPSLVRFWCLWGYSLFVFVPSSFLLVIPVEFLKWLIILMTGAASSCFVALNLKSYVQENDVTVLVVSAFCLQMTLAIFVKAWFFA